jgi:hypothetical protein
MVRVVVVNKGCIHGPMSACDWPGRETWVEKSSLVDECYALPGDDHQLNISRC